MNRLVLAFGIVCLLQGLAASPRPEYGLAVSIKNSGKITAVADDVADFAAYVDTIELPVLTAAYESFDSTLSVVENLIEGTFDQITAILSGYTTLLEATDGDVDGAFQPILDAASAAGDYLNGNDVNGYLQSLGSNDHGGVADQLQDAGLRIFFALQQLISAVTTIKENLINALAANANDANVPTSILNVYLGLADMYAFLKVANDLKAYLPLLDYILKTTAEHLAEGDTFINGLQELIDNVPGENAEAYTEDLNNIIGDIKETVSDGFSFIKSEYDDILADFIKLDISDAEDLSDLLETISSFVSAFDSTATMDALDLSLAGVFAEFTTELSALILSQPSDITPKDEYLVQLLVDGLVGNLEYGEYCYYKYKDLVENLFTQGTDGGWECIDKEYLRLLHLQYTLALILELLAFDFEFMGDELEVCELVNGDAENLNDCVSELQTYYSDLLEATESKRDLLYTLAEGEANASKNRLLICFELNFIDVSINQVADIVEGLEICLDDGPTGSD